MSSNPAKETDTADLTPPKGGWADGLHSLVRVASRTELAAVRRFVG